MLAIPLMMYSVGEFCVLQEYVDWLARASDQWGTDHFMEKESSKKNKE